MKATKIEENEELFDVTEGCSDDDRNMTLNEFLERASELETNSNAHIFPKWQFKAGGEI